MSLGASRPIGRDPMGLIAEFLRRIAAVADEMTLPGAEICGTDEGVMSAPKPSSPAPDAPALPPDSGLPPLLDLWQRELVRTGTKAKNAKRMRVRLATALSEMACPTVATVTQKTVADHLRLLVNGSPERSKTSLKTAENVRWIISTFFVWAKHEGHATFNPADGIAPARTARGTRGRSSRKGMRAFYDDEPLRMIAAAEADEARPATGKRGVRRRSKIVRSVVYKIALMTGARKGQLTMEGGKDDPDPFRWRDTDLDSANPGVTLNDTKNGDNWWIPLVPAAVEVLRDWRERCPGAGPDDLVFPFKIRDPIVNADLKAAGIPKHGGPTNRPANFHSLRKTYCTNLVLSGVPIPVAQQLMQHRTLEMTVRIYTEIRNEQLTAGAARVQDFYNVGKLRGTNELPPTSVVDKPTNAGEDLTSGGGSGDSRGVMFGTTQLSDRSDLRGGSAARDSGNRTSHPRDDRRVVPSDLKGGGISPTAACSPALRAIGVAGFEPPTAFGQSEGGSAVAGSSAGGEIATESGYLSLVEDGNPGAPTGTPGPAEVARSNRAPDISEVEIAARVIDRHPNRAAIIAALLVARIIAALVWGSPASAHPATPPPVADSIREPGR